MNKIVFFFFFFFFRFMYQVINLLSSVCSYAIWKIPMDGCRITFGLWSHVIQHPSIGIFPCCVNKQGITNSIPLRQWLWHHCIFMLYTVEMGLLLLLLVCGYRYVCELKKRKQCWHAVETSYKIMSDSQSGIKFSGYRIATFREDI